MSFQPETNPRDASDAAQFLRRLTKEELVQAEASPRALIGRLPGFTVNHLRTAAETTIVRLVSAEINRCREDRIDHRSRNAFWASIGALVISALATSIALAAWLFPTHR